MQRGSPRSWRSRVEGLGLRPSDSRGWVSKVQGLNRWLQVSVLGPLSKVRSMGP